MNFDRPQGGGQAAVEWSWEGNDEMDPAGGRGWATLQADGTLKGKLYFNRGESSGFTAEKKPSKPAASEKLKPAKSKRRPDAGGTVPLNVDAITPGPIRNPTLSKSLLRRIRAVHWRIKDVYEDTLEQFEIAFMRDADAQGEVELWERIADAFEKAAEQLPDLDRKMVLRTLLGYSMDALTPQEQADRNVRRVLATIGEEQ